MTLAERPADTAATMSAGSSDALGELGFVVAVDGLPSPPFGASSHAANEAATEIAIDSKAQALAVDILITLRFQY
jgi:hypothetical protein